MVSMITDKKLRILSTFGLQEVLTFKDIKKRAKQKSNNAIQLALKNFMKQGIIAKRHAGNVLLYSLNAGNSTAQAYLEVLNNEKISSLPKEAFIIQDRLLKKTALFILLVFGSYAKKTNTKTSDIDVAVITEQKKDIAPILETIKRQELRHIDYHIFTQDEFISMLHEDQENLGKQIYKNCLIVYGYIPYINLVSNERHR